MDKQKKKLILDILRRNRRWVLKQGKGDTCCWCAISAVRVNAHLKMAGLNPVLTVVNYDCEGGHCFNELDGYILDVTADQFEDLSFVGVTNGICFVLKSGIIEEDRKWWWGFDDNVDDDWETFSICRGKKAFNSLRGWGDQSPQHFFKRQTDILKKVSVSP